MGDSTNIKSPFLACDLDDRSPWLLFEQADKIQAGCTQTIYQQYFDSQVKEYAPVDNFKKFVLNESKGEEMLSKFQNTYADRFIDLTVEDLEKKEALSDQALIEHSENLKNQLTQLHDKLKAVDEKIGVFHQVVDKKSNVKTVDYNGINYKKKNIDEGYNKIVTDRQALVDEEFSLWDRKNYTICKVLNDRHQIIPIFEELVSQHKAITQLFRNFINTRTQIIGYLNQLQENDQITEDNIYSVTGTVAKMGRDLNENIKALDLKNFIPLSNLDSFDEFLVTVVPKGALTPPKLNMFENNSYNIFMQEIEQAIGQLNRIDQKSIAIILEKFEEILWRAKEKAVD